MANKGAPDGSGGADEETRLTPDHDRTALAPPELHPTVVVRGPASTVDAARRADADDDTTDRDHDDHDDSDDSFGELLEKMAATPQSPPQEAASLPRGSLVDRYVILGHLGAGGMGTVYKAYDPNLDRRVALKFLVELPGAGARTDRRDRLLREAQALAQLSHPNVVAVHDVGIAGEHVFVAMELVEGETLDVWMKARRSWREILETFIACGRGLAAAHQRAIVHRDFKPQNVIVGADGRPRVLDFGLARAEGEDSGPDDETRSDLERGGRELRVSLTMTGAVMGTPAYMAPEQFQGRRTDGRTDQFAFAITLYLALYGKLPFKDRGYKELMEVVVRGEVREPPPGHKVPGWVHRVILRALSADPDQRWPDMDAMLAALARDPSARRKRIAGGAGVLALAGLAVFGLLREGDQPARCTGASDRLAGVWDAEVEREVAAAFARLRPDTGAGVFALVDPRLDGYAGDWIAMHTAACTAADRGEQSDAMLDLRMACLDRRRDRLAALTALLRNPGEGAVVDTAVSATMELPGVAACADTAALSAAVPPPDDARVAAEVEALRARLDVAQVLTNAGQVAQALPLAQAITREARTIDYPPIQAEALRLESLLHTLDQRPEPAETTTRAAIEAAARARDHQLVAEGWIQLIEVVGHLAARHDEALTLETPARIAIAQADGRERLAGAASATTAIVLAGRGDLDRALAGFERAEADYARSLGADHPAVGSVQNWQASVLRQQGKYEPARARYEAALALRIRVLGGGHPDVADSLNGIGLVLHTMGKYDEARGYFERALGIRRASLGESHSKIATVLNNLGLAAWYGGELEAAVDYFRRSREIWVAALGPDHPNTATPTANLGSVLADLRRWDEARVAFEQTIATYTRAHDARHPKLADPRMRLGLLELGRDDPEAAARHCRDALALVEGKRGPDDPLVINASLCLGMAELGAGRPRDAIPRLEAVLAILVRDKLDPATTADVEFALARALWDARTNRPRALALARQANERLTHMKQGGDLREKIAAWLAKRT